ncbi:PI-actitoxin-Afv2a-like [Anoplophora glabripennis]|uniref:PI-actitoxin-Afv2a-like n=1 Tax=Anoplophora glabripennis TaxID=217634 RepID=UPI00087433E5|nr:PI-actitoxin-Afv2a-like [Anoplophora glabripennis]
MSKLVIVVILATLAVALCRPAAKDDPQVACKLPMVKGYCRALLPRWRYDPSIGKCVEFKYGGCNGNANNFMTQKACSATCEGVF